MAAISKEDLGTAMHSTQGHFREELKVLNLNLHAVTSRIGLLEIPQQQEFEDSPQTASSSET